MLKSFSGILVVVLFSLVSRAVPTAAQAPPAAKAVDFCGLLTTAEAGAILGAVLSEATPQTAQGSLLGGCKYGSAAGLVTLNARPTREFAASVKAYKDLQALDGAGAGVTAHYSPTIGMLISQASKPYFLHVMIVGGKGPKTSERFLTVAKKIVEKG